MAPKIDFGIQGLPHEEVEQDEEKSRRHYVGRLVSAIMNHEKRCFECRIAKQTSVYAVQRGIKPIFHTR